VLIFGYTLASIEAACVWSATASAALFGVLVSGVIAAAIVGRRRRARRAVTHDAVPESRNTLGLSPALE
jgi:hypothetical protein